MTPDQAQAIEDLRARNLSPKQIARQLGLRPTEVKSFIRAKATEANLERLERGELPPIKECLINEDAARHLLGEPSKGWLSRLKNQDLDHASSGLAVIFVTRVDRGQNIICNYLVDSWCLGVKDTFGPRKLNDRKYQTLIERGYEMFDHCYCEISLEEVQAIVFGAVEYANQLGFKPHRDFEKSRHHLGQPSDHLPAVEFGRDGKPFYVSGPYDNPERVVATLQESVGEGNFDFVLGMEDPEGPFLGFEQ